MTSSHLIFLGTYTRTSTSRGIYVVRFDGDSGTFTEPRLVAEAADPTWLEFSPDRTRLYSVHPSAGQARGFAVDAARGTLSPLPARPSAAANQPSHLAVDATGSVLVAANYRDGYVVSMSILPDGTLGEPHLIRHEGQSVHPTRQQEAHPHAVVVSPDNRFVIVPDLGLDRIFTYALDPATARLTPGEVPYVAANPGAGPRHFKFMASGRHACVVNELGNTVTTYDFDPVRGALTPTKDVSTLPPGFTDSSTTAEIRIHPNGRFVYASNRGHDSIAVFALDPATGLIGDAPLEIVASGGRTPRNFALSPDGRWLVCGHQDSEWLTVLRVDPVTGRLARTTHTARVPGCVCVLFHS